MEDMLEDAHVSSQREEAALKEKIQRLKEKDEGMRKELGEGHREVERMAKAEVKARNRVEEIEEALRESTVALENARAEVESLRAELAVSSKHLAHQQILQLRLILESRRTGRKQLWR